MSPRALSAARLDDLVGDLAAVRDEELRVLADEANAFFLLEQIISDGRSEGTAGDENIAVPATLGHRARVPLLLAAAAVVLVLALLSSLLLVRSPNSQLTNETLVVVLRTKAGAAFKARVPSRAVHRDQIDLSALPSELPVIVGSSVVGVINRSDIQPTVAASTGLPPGATCGTGGVAVYGHTPGRIVGHLYPGAGYVPLGEIPNCSASGLSGATPTTLTVNPSCGALISSAKSVEVKQCGTATAPPPTEGAGTSGNSGGGNSGTSGGGG